MNQLDIITLLYVICSHHITTFILFGLFMIAKIFLLYIVGTHWRRAANPIPLFLLSISIVSYLIGEAAMISLCSNNHILRLTLWRIAWNMQPVQFYSQILFTHSLIQQKYKMQHKDKLVLYMLFIFALFPLILLFVTPDDNNVISNLLLDIFCRAGVAKRFIVKILGSIFLVLTLYVTWKKTTDSSIAIPHILRAQLKVFFILLCIPLLPDCALVLIDLLRLQQYFTFTLLRLIDLLSVASFTISALFFARRIYHLRFLNLTDRVIAGPTLRLTDEQLLKLKHALCKAKNVSEFGNIHAAFFDQLAHIAPERITFHLCKPEQRNTADRIGRAIEQFIQDKPEIAAQFFVEDSLLVYDELAFTYFYEQSKDTAALLSFLDQIDAAVFIPLKHINRFFGAIIITKELHRQNELFSLAVQIKMRLYGTFVMYALAQFDHISYYTLLEEHKMLSLELYKTNQKNARFHETIVSLLKPETLRKNGILLYKNSLFSCLSNIAEELLQINPNFHQGHPLAKALKEVVRRVNTYGIPHSIIEKNISGIDICCQAFPYKKDELVILVSPADITHVIPIEQALLQPADIDYAIFLYATDAGAIISQAFPGGGTMIHQAKVQFLKTLLSKKIMLLDVHPEDRDICLDIAQRICHRTIVRSINPATTTPDIICTALFGKQLFTHDDIVTEQGLLYTLDQSGIIHIVNAHCLDPKTQELLVRFLKTGFFCVYKTEQRQPSNVTIIMSSSADLQALAKQGLFSEELYAYLHDAIITLPSLFSLPFSELDSLARSFQKKLITAPEYHHVFGFSSTEQQQLDANRPESYTELRQRISRWIKQCVSQSSLAQETTLYAPKKESGDSAVLEAARRGKQTLKDRKIMRELWDTFQNQSKIAQLLDVDRSSVHRRLKEYGIVGSGSDE